MIERNKDCTLCVYNGPCQGRKDRVDIKDCCIPEAPLRKLQQENQNNLERFIFVTQHYVQEIKMASRYWRKIMGVKK